MSKNKSNKNEKRNVFVRNEDFNWVGELDGITIDEAVGLLDIIRDRYEKEIEELGYTIRLHHEQLDYDYYDTYISITRLETDEELALRLDKAAERRVKAQKRKEAKAARKAAEQQALIKQQAEQEQAERDLYERLKAKFENVDTKRT